MEMHLVFFRQSYGNISEATQHPDGLTVIAILFSVSSANLSISQIKLKYFFFIERLIRENILNQVGITHIIMITILENIHYYFCECLQKELKHSKATDASSKSLKKCRQPYLYNCIT